MEVHLEDNESEQTNKSTWPWPSPSPSHPLLYKLYNTYNDKGSGNPSQT